YLNNLPSSPKHPYLIKQLPRTLGKIARRNESLKDLTFSSIIKLKKTDDKWLDVFEELQAEFPNVN
ncbi:MAG: hypothetical protein ACI93S_001342, partial [Ancylomarina sp.]